MVDQPPALVREPSKDYLQNSYENLKSDQPKFLGCIALTTIVVVATATLGVYLGMYGYGNSDPEHCYFILGLKDTVRASEEEIKELAGEQGVSISRGYPLDIAWLFRTYFQWGFWNIVIHFLVAIVTGIVYMCNPRYAMFQFGALFCAVETSTFLQFFLGILWRFSSVGKLASGETLKPEEVADGDILSEGGYQLQGGKFMRLIVYIYAAYYGVWSLILVSGCIWSCILPPKQSRNY